MASNRQRANSGRGGAVLRGLLSTLVVSLGLAGTALAQGPTANTRREGQRNGASGAAFDVGRSDGRGHAAADRSSLPSIAGNLPSPVWVALGSAYRMAQERLRTNAQCGELFTNLGALGPRLLGQAIFAPSSTSRDRDVCAGCAVAVTEVRGRVIRLCPRFGELPVRAAALILIHETLHLAGLRERPPDPTALTSAEINTLVAANCGR